MKKTLNFFAAAALVVFAAVACQKEQLSDISSEGEETVTFTVQTDAAATKATADNDGRGAGLKRCLVAVYMKTGDQAQPYKLYETLNATQDGADEKRFTFTVNLIRKQTYQIVVWADKGKYTVPADLSSVTRIADDKACNSDAYDAFYASTEFVQGTTTYTTITATRPFAQLNLITKDLNEHFQPGAVSVTYSSPQSFYPFDGTVSAATTEVIYTANSPYYTSTAGEQHTLVMNYLFAAAGDQTILPSVKMTAMLTVDAEIEVANVPVKRNYRTNIIGNLLTEQTNFNITVEPAWGGSDIDQYIAATVAGNPYTSIEEAFQHATNGETIILANNVETAGITVPAGATTILNLAGKTITAAPQTRSANGETALTVAGELTIIGEGTVNGGAGGNNKAVYVVAGGKAIINGGYFTVGADANGLGNSCIECNGGEVVINGGYFRTEAAYNNFYYVLNQINSNPGTIQVTGGKFENYDPTRGDDNLLGTFVASGYTSVKISDEPVVYEVGPVGYMGAILPVAPVVVGNVMTVNTENAQYALDGAYGSIDGMTIHFSAGTYPQLIFGRPNKYPGSHTLYRHGNFDNAPMSYEDFVAYKSQNTWTENCYYERSISNVTFTAESGAVLTGMSYNAGAHIYGSAESPVYDYVLDNGTIITTTNGSYYHKLVASNIVYEGITFQKVAAYRPLEISPSSAISVINGVTVSNCKFIGTGTEKSVGQAIRFYTENQSGAAGTEGKVVRNLVVENTTINNFYQGIYTNGAYGVTVKGCQISNTGHNAIALQSISAAVNLGQVKILSNRFENIGDRIIRLGNVAAGSSFTITGNVATNSGDTDGQVLKAESLASGITYDIHNNDWGEGKIVYNPEFRDQPAQSAN